MNNIKKNIGIIILSLLIATSMYPKTYTLIKNLGKNLYTASQLGTNTLQYTKEHTVTNKINVVFMFDSGYSSVYTHAYTLLKEYNYKASISIIPSLVNEPQYMSYDQLAELYLDGWSLLNHTYNHYENMYDKCDELLLDFNKARQWMTNRYIGQHSDMAILPYGEINPYLIQLLKNAGYINIRTSDNIILLNNNIEYLPIITINLLSYISVDEVTSTLTEAYKNKKTIIIILNKIGETDEGYNMTYSRKNLDNIIEYININSDKFEVINYSQLF